MIEVAPRLYVGNQLDYETKVKGKDGWRIVQCAKDPYHRQALGYTGRAAPRDHAEYLWANRDNRLILNMVDVEDPAYIRPEMIDNALDFIGHALAQGNVKVLVHCNQGGSRAPGLALLYLRNRAEMYGDMSYEETEEFFRGIYPNYQPAGGIRGYLIAHWDDQPKRS